MKIFSFLLAVAFSGICLGAETAPTPQAKELSYEGKTLGEWLALAKDKDAKGRASAAEALEKIGPEAKAAIPALTELLKDKDERVRYYAGMALGRIAPISTVLKLLNDEDRIVRGATAIALGRRTEPDNKIVIPALTGLLNDKDEGVRGAAAE